MFKRVSSHLAQMCLATDGSYDQILSIIECDRQVLT